jgi:hypothetical protein
MQAVLRLSLFKAISWYLVVAMVVIGITPRVYAGFVSSEAINLSPGDRVSDLQKIQKILETKMISQRLTELGYSSDEIKTRLSALNDQQIHQFALQIDQVKVAGDGMGFIIGVLVIAILVILLIYLLGHKVVIK